MLAPTAVIRGDEGGGSPFGPRLGAFGLITGDFNRDRMDDIAFVWTTSLGEALLLFLSNGDGTFQPARRLIDNVSTALAGDFNGDGKLDLATVSDHGLVILLGNGNGTFQPPILSAQTLNISGPGRPNFVEAADYNGDGKLDLVFNDGTLALGDGKGGFGAGQPLPFSPVLGGDFNRDGIRDFMGSAGNGISIYLGIGNGTFRAGIPLPPNMKVPAAVADFNGDGIPDIVAVSSPTANLIAYPYSSLLSDTQIFLGKGDGTFRDPITSPGFGGPVVVADFNRDGQPDLFSGFGLMVYQGSGSFLAPLPLYTPGVFCFRQSMCSGGVIQAAVGDLNGDGLPDIIYAFGGFSTDGPQVLAFLNAGKGDGILESAVPAATHTGVAALGSIVSSFGVDMALTTEAAPGPPYPTELGGIRVHIGDQLAPLFYVSPTQINYYLPSVGGRLANQTISIERIGSPFVPKGIAAAGIGGAPGLFTVDSSGLAVRVAPNGTQTPVPVVDCTTGTCAPVAIDTSGDPVYLSLYGTGFYSFAEFSKLVRCGGGTTVYAGPQGQIPGPQQINSRLNSRTVSASPVKVPLSCFEQQVFLVNDQFPTNYTSNTVYILV